jgi:hypothetical protein
MPGGTSEVLLLQENNVKEERIKIITEFFIKKEMKK